MNRQLSQNRFPHVYIILIILLLIASVLTYVIPAGCYERIDGVAVADSFTYTQQQGVPFWELPLKFFEAVTAQSTAKIIFFILIIGGAFEIVMQSGAISALCGLVVKALRNHRVAVIPIFVCLFSVFGFTMGLTTAAIVFVPLGISIAEALGYDKMTGMAMVMLGTNAGFAAGVYNPFSVGIAQEIACVPLYSGAWIRWILLIVLLAVTCSYILIKCRRQTADNTISVNVAEKFTFGKALVIVFLAITLVIITVGVSNFKWSIAEISAVFIFFSIAAGIAARFTPNKCCKIFTDGCKKMMSGVLVIGIAATIRAVLSAGGILDTITYTLIENVNNLPAWAHLLGMFYGNALLDPMITSGTAHASVAMPIMVPMADALSLSRQSTVFAFQLGDGLMNLVSPISTTLTGCLAISNVPFRKWVKFFYPLVGIYLIIGTVFIIFAGAIEY